MSYKYPSQIFTGTYYCYFSGYLRGEIKAIIFLQTLQEQPPTSSRKKVDRSLAMPLITHTQIYTHTYIYKIKSLECWNTEKH
jgi:hypothetical protein